MSDIVRAIDESPLLRLLGECLMAAPGFLGKIASGAVQTASEVGSSVGQAFSAVKDVALGSGVSMGRDGPEISPVRERVQEIAPPSRVEATHVDMSELGSFAPPSFGGNMSVGQGMGR